jgi:cephalosporin hydroxylase
MITPDFSYCKTLKEFSNEIKIKQSSAHGPEYISNHIAIEKYVSSCEIVKEIGVCQGGTLSTLMRQNPKKIIGQDITQKHFEPYKHLFDKYAIENNIEFIFKIENSLNSSSADLVDFLHIDSKHTPKHLMEELRIHAPCVSKYIAFHDTANYKAGESLFVTIAKYITEIDQSWKIVDHYIHNVGYTVIERVNRIKSHEK